MRNRRVRRYVLLCHCAGAALSGSAAGGPFGDAVIHYDAGVNPIAGYTDPGAVIGSPARFTGVQYGFPSVVSPFSPAFDPGEIVSVGFGGSLTLRMGRTIRDETAHRFGIDFIVFGNAGFIDVEYPQGSVGDGPAFFGQQAPVFVEVSVDGSAWSPVAVRALDLWPTLGYRDAGPFDGVAGSTRTSFTRAMDPSLALGDVAGMSYAELVGVYGRSGGGIGFDLASSGLSEANYVRFTHAGSADQTFQIDAVAAVPSPAGVPLLLGVAGVWRTRRRRAAGA